MGCGAFTVIWPYDESPAAKMYSHPATDTTTNKQNNSGEGDLNSRPKDRCACGHFTVLCSTAELPPDICTFREKTQVQKHAKFSIEILEELGQNEAKSHGQGLKHRGPGLVRKKRKEEKKQMNANFSRSKNAGWISCDRCNKASLHITIPGLEFKSSTNDPREFKSSVAVRTAKVRMVLARRLSELQPMRTPKTSRVLVGFPA